MLACRMYEYLVIGNNHIIPAGIVSYGQRGRKWRVFFGGARGAYSLPGISYVFCLFSGCTCRRLHMWTMSNEVSFQFILSPLKVYTNSNTTSVLVCNTICSWYIYMSEVFASRYKMRAGLPKARLERAAQPIYSIA